LDAVDEIKGLFPDQENLAPLALRWILDYPEVSTIIPGSIQTGTSEIKSVIRRTASTF
jgi:predicted aldo/keto reductase-like oxidoreductase